MIAELEDLGALSGTIFGVYTSSQGREEISTPLLWPEKSFDAKKLYYELPKRGLAHVRG